jgi:hypothetical protein
VKKIAKIDYDKMKFVFVTDHWDIHLAGLCEYNGKLHYFETVDEREYECNPLFIESIKFNGITHKEPYFREIGELYCVIYSMSLFEKINQLWRKKLFEVCVGYHWSYPNRRDTVDNKPYWLKKLLWKMYFYLR